MLEHLFTSCLSQLAFLVGYVQVVGTIDVFHNRLQTLLPYQSVRTLISISLTGVDDAFAGFDPARPRFSENNAHDPAKCKQSAVQALHTAARANACIHV